MRGCFLLESRKVFTRRRHQQEFAHSRVSSYHRNTKFLLSLTQSNRSFLASTKCMERMIIVTIKWLFNNYTNPTFTGREFWLKKKPGANTENGQMELKINVEQHSKTDYTGVGFDSFYCKTFLSQENSGYKLKGTNIFPHLSIFPIPWSKKYHNTNFVNDMTQ